MWQVEKMIELRESFMRIETLRGTQMFSEHLGEKFPLGSYKLGKKTLIWMTNDNWRIIFF